MWRWEEIQEMLYFTKDASNKTQEPIFHSSAGKILFSLNVKEKYETITTIYYMYTAIVRE